MPTTTSNNLTNENIARKFGALGLTLRPLTVKGGEQYTSLFVDQYGRVLQAFVDDKGHSDLRPIGIEGIGF